MANPIWASVIAATIRKLSRKCPHCGKTGTYSAKQPGQFHTCHHCGHRFKEKEKNNAA